VTLDQIAGTVWQRRALFVLVVVLSTAAVVTTTLSLPPVYRATATLFVGSSDVRSVEADQSDTLVRTYATLAGNPNVAEAVRQRVQLGLSRDAVLDRMRFLPLQGTRLIELSAEGPTPDEAQVLANAYAAEFAQRLSREFPASQGAAALRVQEAASRPGGPIRPQRGLYIGFGLILALVLGVAATLLREATAAGLGIPQEAAAFEDYPILARIANMPRRTDRQSGHRFADSFRLLRTNLNLNADAPATHLMITSPSELEGKTTVALNLAQVYADDEDVVLIEADLRRPGLTRDLAAAGFAPEQLGLTDYLQGLCSEDEILIAHPEYPRLSVVLAGAPVAEPTALLSSAAFGTLLRSLRARSDRVIIDTPPVSVGADASVLAPKVEGVLYVMDDGRTKRSLARTGLNQLRTVRAPITGVVLNRVATGAAAYYFTPSPPPAEPRERRSLRRRRDVASPSP
jgi:capsular exopolysaccharide synthesis family protein